MKTLTKSQYDKLKNDIISNPALTVQTKAKTNRKRLQHKTTIISELGTLILKISGSETSYLFKEGL